MENLLENIFDIETDGINPTKIHCLVASDGSKLTDYDDMRAWLSRQKYLIGHNIIRYDVPVLERILGIKVKAKLVDTLILSWYLCSERVQHGLEQWGEEFGVPKPKIDDWENLTIEEYLHRCEEDVKINTRLWKGLYKRLKSLYGDDKEIARVVAYLSFKMDCVAVQEQLRWKVDIEAANRLQWSLDQEVMDRKEQLASVMPKVPVYKIAKKPKKPYKMNGELSAAGEKWVNLCKEHGYDGTFEGEFKYISSHKEPNPTSSQQIKSWLIELGWVPQVFNYVRDKETNDVRKIPQVNAGGGELCPDVLRLIRDVPELEALNGLSIAQHRLGVVNAFIDKADDDGYIQATVAGLTNTFRFKHAKPVVNLPSVDKPWGKEIRGLLITPDGYEQVGSDMASLEDRTKQHYMWPHDPEYVKEMQTEDFDPHLDLAAMAGMLTPKQVREHKAGEANHSGARKKGKAANYACVYGAQGPTVARSAGISEAEGTKLVDTYWKRNWSVLAIAEEQEVKTSFKKKWLRNPISGFWHELRYEKDRFSTLNQSSGVYCFDSWVKEVRKFEDTIIGQMHDEIIMLKPLSVGREVYVEALKKAVKVVNKRLKLNRELDVDVQFGASYAEIH